MFGLMGRGSRTADSTATLSSQEARDTLRSAGAPSVLAGPPLDISAAFDAVASGPAGPDWRTPADAYVAEAEEFCDPRSAKYGGMDLDPVVAVRLLKLRFDGDFHRYRRWYEGWAQNVVGPEQTVPGMAAAGDYLSAALDAGEKIAVYCDYDVDGTAAGQALRAGLEPYLRSADQLVYGYADAQAGFGLTNDFVQQANDAGARTIVTLDCGSGQAAQVRLAQSLGMKVIVVDHHGVDPDNPADHHLNPLLSDPPSSHNTGAQLAWKLAAATQISREGRTRPELWHDAMFTAGMGCLADMGSVLMEENRTFFWHAAEHVPAGVRMLAERLGEEPIPGGMVLTQAAMNLPKRTTLVDAADIGALLAAVTGKDAAPLVDKLASAYEDAKPVRREMLEAAMAQVTEKVRGADGEADDIADRDKLMSYVVLDGYENYNGYSGPTASRVSSKVGKPAFVFVRKGVDEHGQTLYRFSSRNEARVSAALGELAERDDMRAACTILKTDEAGQTTPTPTCGGHTEVFSGTCTAENLPAVMAAADAWAAEKAPKGWYPQPWNGAEAYLSARNVPATRLSAIEQQAKRLGPFSSRKNQNLYYAGNSRHERREANSELRLSVTATLQLTGPDPDNDTWMCGTLDLGQGVTREVRYPADVDERPVGQPCEWVLRVGGSGPYYLRLFHKPATPPERPI